MKTLKSLVFMSVSLVLFSGLLASTPSRAVDDEGFYHNGRFNFVVSYPSFFVGQGEALNGDGQRFKTGDGKAEFAVYGMWQIWPLPEYYKMHQEWALEKGTITYKVLGKSFFVISGFKGDRVYYQKTYLAGEVFKTFEIEYPSAQRAKYDPIVTRMSKAWH